MILMRRWAKKFRYLLAMVVIGTMPLINTGSPVEAVGSCVVGISPDTVDAGSSTNFTVTVTNTRPAAIQWVDINVPVDFSYGGNSVNGWTSTDHDGGSTFTGSTITSGQSYDFLVSAQAGTNLGTANWSIRASGDPGGSGPSICAGQSGITVNAAPANQVINVAVSDITDSSATVTWDTTSPSSSIVYYGTTSGYGSATNEDTTLSTGHSVALSGLNDSQNYHFQVSSTDGNNSTATSSDNTFVTAAAPPPSGGGGNNNGGGNSSGGGVNSSGGGNSVTTPIPAKTTIPKGSKKANIIPPTILLSTKIESAYKTPPVITGSATDNEQVKAIEFSTDGGANWLPVDSAQGLGTTSATFTTGLPPLLDGNYQLEVRSIDNDGATAVSASQILVIDQLPPLISALSSSIGSQQLDPDKDGVIQAVENMDQRIIAGAQGGPISITINAAAQGSTRTLYSYSLSRSQDDGLWQGVISFHAPGTYELTVKAVDGANNNTIRSLGKVIVKASGRVLGGDSKPVKDAKVKVFYKDQETDTWAAWDGEAYDQSSQLTTTSKGGYSLFLPYGTYYISASAQGYSTLTSRSFSISAPTVVSTDLHLSPDHGISIAGHRLALPWYHSPVTVVASKSSKAGTAKQAASKPMPAFSLSTTAGKKLSTSDLLGKPTVVTFLTTWSLSSQEQLPLSANKNGADFNWVLVGSGESLSRWTNYVSIAGYNTPVVVDSTNQLAQVFGLGSVPSHYFFDRHGNLYDSKVGIMSGKEIINNLKN